MSLLSLLSLSLSFSLVYDDSFLFFFQPSPPYRCREELGDGGGAVKQEQKGFLNPFLPLLPLLVLVVLVLVPPRWMQANDPPPTKREIRRYVQTNRK